MDYDGALSYLKGFEKLGYRFRLENTRELLESLGFDFAGDVVHVAGTNGKGSCAAALSVILQKSGRRVGLYTSPELIDFTERIRVNGRQIKKREFARRTAELKPLIDSMEDKPTFFEATTALALKHFADSEVDTMVLEVGMGGRLDSTNAIPSKLSIITNVQLDHMQYLGNTVEAIAHEKAGIIREGSTVVTGAEGGALHVLEKECKLKAASILRIGSELKVSDTSTSLRGTSFKLKTPQNSYFLHSPMRGKYQALNISCAAAAAEKLGVRKKDIVSGVSDATWPGRLDVVQKNPMVILDCAHNPAGIAESHSFIKRTPHNHLIVVAGFSKDKDYSKMIETLLDADLFIATEYQGERSLKAAEILRHVKGVPSSSAKEAVKQALKVAGKGDIIFVAGSIYVIGVAMLIWKKRIDF
ncbi:MAG: folylpolyglutamate synthase/dihydrofolate synthase family protein [Candidatus Altiarchaeota archaeon]